MANNSTITEEKSFNQVFNDLLEDHMKTKKSLTQDEFLSMRKKAKKLVIA